ncbi:uncharacterized protein PAC_07252 [Phialocephala subalpina]|uniref:Methyltransferase domain-containing protein n=1 Tax=Phialocephala subalpina TaxID=576137 RepID=A0A1L7WX77_9HELO|nr:uncharacterized protein PAC_07252 [Phialocephala subalpina]
MAPNNEISSILPATAPPQKSIGFAGADSLARQLLEQYSGIPRGRVKSHIRAIVVKASQHPDPYPCITSFRFLQFEGTQHPLFDTILYHLTTPNSKQTLLDIGCCFGQDIRMYAFRGAPTQNLYGVDLYPEFLGLGYELFNDTDRFGVISMLETSLRHQEKPTRILSRDTLI